MNKELREVYVETVRDIALNDDNVFVLEADLATSMGTDTLKHELGNRYINVGIAEGQAICVAAGIAAAGGVAFVHSFASFLTRRAFDQIFISLAYAKQHAILIGSDAGITTETNGGTHMCFEDMALMRSIPNAYVYDISDTISLEEVLRYSYTKKGLHYIRTARKKVDKLYDNKNVDIEKGYSILKRGKDITLMVSGILAGEALKAADLLAEYSIDVQVVNIHKVKPIPCDIVQASIKKGVIFTLENHNVIGGLGSAIAEYTSAHSPVYVYRMGVQNQFGQVGKLDYLKNVYGLDFVSIADTIRKNFKKEVQI